MEERVREKKRRSARAVCEKMRRTEARCRDIMRPETKRQEVEALRGNVWETESWRKESGRQETLARGDNRWRQNLDIMRPRD